MGALEAHDLWWLHGWDDLEKVDVFWRSPCHLISSPKVLSGAPGLLHFIDLSVQEVGWCGHLAEDGGEVVWPLLFKVGLMGLLLDPSSCLYNIGLLGEGLLPGLLQGLSLPCASCEGILLALHHHQLPSLHHASVPSEWVHFGQRSGAGIFHPSMALESPTLWVGGAGTNPLPAMAIAGQWLTSPGWQLSVHHW